MRSHTSIEAYHKLCASPYFSKRRKEVFDILYEAKEPLTGAEVSRRHREKYKTNPVSEIVRNRLTELVQMGVVDIEESVLDMKTKQHVNTFQCRDFTTVMDPRPTHKYTRKKIKKLFEAELQKLVLDVERLKTLASLL